MKTDQSTIKRKLNLELAQDIITDLGVTYLKKWTETELKLYRTTPIVIPTGDYGFLVGTYRITGINSHCWQVNQIDGKFIHNFMSKTNAVLYCIFIMKSKYIMAQDLLNLDRKIGNLEADIASYGYFLGKKTKDDFKYTVMLNRYVDAKMKKKALNNILKKTVNAAKYMNFGNKPL